MPQHLGREVRVQGVRRVGAWAKGFQGVGFQGCRASGLLGLGFKVRDLGL